MGFAARGGVRARPMWVCANPAPFAPWRAVSARISPIPAAVARPDGAEDGETPDCLGE